MPGGWREVKNDWLKRTALNEEVSSWAVNAIEVHQETFEGLKASYEKNKSDGKNGLGEEGLKELKKKIKNEMTHLENTLDDLSLNAPNTYKLQISVPSNLNYLMKAWAAAEGRDLSSVALQCLEIGLREMKSNGGIPSAALRRYDNACEKRIALAETNQVWEQFNSALCDKTL